MSAPSSQIIVCPPWCTIPAADHAANLELDEGRAIHWSADGLASVAKVAFPDGTPDPEEPLRVHVGGSMIDDGLTLERAEQLARDLLALVELVKVDEQAHR